MSAYAKYGMEGLSDLLGVLSIVHDENPAMNVVYSTATGAIQGFLSCGPAGALTGAVRNLGISLVGEVIKSALKSYPVDRAIKKGSHLDPSSPTMLESIAKGVPAISTGAKISLIDFYGLKTPLQSSNSIADLPLDDSKKTFSVPKMLRQSVSDEHEGFPAHQYPHEIVVSAARYSSKEQNALKDEQGNLETFQDDTSEVVSNIDKLNDSVGKKLTPKVKDLADNVEEFDEVASKDLQAGRKYMFGQFGLDESGMPLGGLPEEKKPLSVADSEKKNSGEAEDDEVKLTDVFKQVAGGLSTLGYDLKGVGNFEKAINKIQEASKLGKDGKTDSTEAYIEGIGNLMMGVGANIGGDFGNALSSTASMALTGLEIAGGNPIGAVIGGAVGLISSIFGGDDEEERKEAEREKIRQQIYQGMLSRSLSGSGPYSLKMLRESNWDYDKLKKQFGKKDEEELIKYQNRLELLDDIGASLEQIGSPEIVRSIDQVRAKYEYAAKSVKGMLDIASAEMTEISAQVFGLTADNLVSMFDSAIETAEDAGHAGRLIAEALELQIVDSFKKLAISQAINEAVMPMLQPILNELVAGALSGGLSAGEMADLVLQAQEIAASVAPAVSSLYGAFDEAGVLNYSYSSTPFESQGSYNGPVITGGTGVANGQQNDTRGDRPVQVVVQVANHEFETMVTELADNVFVKAERRKGVVNAQKVFG